MMLKYSFVHFHVPEKQ